MKPFLSAACAAAAILLTPAMAAPITAQGYSYVSAPKNSYPDSTGQELTDGVVETTSFSDGVWSQPSQAFRYVGWQNRAGVIDFSFDGAQAINSIEVFFMIPMARQPSTTSRA